MRFFIEADSIVADNISGIGHATLEIMKALDKQADINGDLDVVAIIPHGKRAIVERYGFKNIKIKELWRGQKIINYILARTSLPFPIDIWFGKGIYIFPDYKNWFVPFSRSITFIHDVAFKKYPETVNDKNRNYLDKNILRWLGRTSRIVTISKASATELKRYFPQFSSKMSVIYLGVDPQVFYRQPEAKVRKTAMRYGLPKDYFLFVGNIEPRKNLSTLLDAYKLYSDNAKNPKALVIVGGGGWNNEEILAKINTFQSTGYKIYRPKSYVLDEDLPAIYSGAEALVHVAIHEGFGLPPIQAQSCGVPIIASDIAALREVLQGDDVIFVSPDNVKEIAEAMKSINKISTSQICNFTWDQTAANIIDLGKELVTK